MLFNSPAFLIFFTLVYALYLICPYKWQNRMLLAASYIFYGWWDWRFLSLLFISTVIDYYCGIKIDQTAEPKKKRAFVVISIVCNLVLLGFFKYYNFFTDNLLSLLGKLGIHPDLPFINIILPVGISFYTFQTMSYSIDIYRKELRPTRNFFDFALFVSFFPQLVAGPIERAKNLLPQILHPRQVTIEKFQQGCWLILWGLFMKVYVADNLARIADPVYAQSAFNNGLLVIIATYAYAFQIFCDFAGYSNIARGLGKCMGFDIMINFRTPYFSSNPREFWQRWHISLSTWLRDYLYIPLGGNRKGPCRTYLTLFLTMALGGLWHGTAWHFVFWGIYHGMLLAIHRLLLQIKSLLRPKPNANTLSVKIRIFGSITYFLKILFFFQLICIGWIFFRAQTGQQILAMLYATFTSFSFSLEAQQMIFQAVWFICPLLLIHFFEYKAGDINFITRWPPLVQQTIYFIILLLLISGGAAGGRQFIYFQF